MQFSYCNHGNPDAHCPWFPAGHRCSTLRYHVLSQNGPRLSVMVIEELDYAPIRWDKWSVDVAGGELVPALADPARRAQLLAFSRSYLALLDRPAPTPEP